MKKALNVLLATFASLASAQAEVLSSDRAGFYLQHVATSALSPEAVWERLMEPSEWWDGDHTYSGSAQNLSMEDTAGSYWREDWEGGSVLHGQILTVKNGEELVLSAPFGPLQGTAANCIWTIQISPGVDGGTQINSMHVVIGGPKSALNELAGAVDYVMSNGIDRLAASPE